MPAIAEFIPQLIAHRGNAHEFPENTLPSLRSALELGIRHVEFDVHLSADNIPVVMHDSNLLRCADVDRDALGMEWAELRSIPVGESKRFGTRFSDVCIPSLAQVVELLSAFPQAKAFVELKRASLRKLGVEHMVQCVAEILKPIAAQVVIISFDLPAINYAKQHTSMPVGWVLPDYDTLSAIKAEATLPHYLFCDHLKLPANSSRLWRGPWQWALYEVANKTEAEQLAARGAHLVESMQARHMLHELNELRAKHLPDDVTTRP